MFVSKIISHQSHWPRIFHRFPLELSYVWHACVVDSITNLSGHGAEQRRHLVSSENPEKQKASSLIPWLNPQAITYITAALGFKSEAFKVNEERELKGRVGHQGPFLSRARPKQEKITVLSEVLNWGKSHPSLSFNVYLIYILLKPWFSF